MRPIQLLLICGCSLFILSARAQDSTNAPATKIENFELRTGTVIVKAFQPVNSLATEAGTVSVHCKESTDIFSGQIEYGITVALDSNQARGFLVVDYDELSGLIRGMDFLARINYNVTTMPAFDASFATRSGLKISAHSDQRQGGIHNFLQFSNAGRIPLTNDQFAQLENLIGQAKATLDGMQTKSSAP